MRVAATSEAPPQSPSAGAVGESPRPPEKPDPWDDAEATRDLRAKTLRGGAATMAGQACKLVLTVLSTAVLARLLDPEDFGLMGMVAVVVGFLLAVGDMGLSVAVIQREKLERAQVDKLFWIGLAVQVVLAALTAAAAPLLGLLYGEPAVVEMTIVMSVGFVIAGLGMTQLALLRRRLRFGSVTLIEVGSLIGGIALGISSAVLGAGYWALVFMQLGQRSLETIGACLVCRWRPRWPKRETEVRPLLRFGGFHTGFAFVNYFARNSDNLLIGWFWGAAPLGLYTRAYGLLMMPLVQLNVPITGVTLPALSRLQNEPERFRRAYLKALGLLSTLGLPLVVFTIVAAPEIIYAFLGPKWLGVVPIFRCLGIVGIAQLVTNTCGMLFVACGRTEAMFRFGIWSTIATLAVFAAAIPAGIEVLAMSYATYTWVIALPILAWATRRTPVTVNDILRTIARPAFFALALGLLLWGVASCTTGFAPITRLVIASAVSGVAWLVFVRKIARDLDPIRLFAELRKKPA